jgi:outer membrane protein TolC
VCLNERSTERVPIQEELSVQGANRLAIVLMTVALTGGEALAQPQAALVPAPAQSPSVQGTYRLTLDDAKERALANNRELTLARLNVMEKSFATSAAKRDYLPKLLGNVNYFHFNQALGKVATFRTGNLGILPPGTQTIAVNVVNQNASLAAITLAQPITKLIVINAAVQIARADTEIASAQLDKGTRDLLSGVAQAFYALHGASRIQAALEMQVDFAGKLAQSNPKAEVRVAFIEAEQALLQVRKQTSDLTGELNGLLDLPAGTELELVEPMPPAVPVISADEAVQYALHSNPQIGEAQANIEKARGALRIARAEYLPDVNIFGSYFNQTSASYIQPNFGALGIAASYTFVDWGKRRQVKNQREMQIAMAQQNLQVTIGKIEREARTAYLGYEQAQQTLKLAGDMVEARKLAENGLIDPSELQVAKTASAKSELEYMQAEIAYRVAHAQLMGVIRCP